MIWLSLALCFSGFTALCLSMDRHHQQVFGQKPPQPERLIFQIGGWLTLPIACAPCILEFGPSIGIALWLTELSLAALSVLLLLSYRPRLILPLALAAPSISLPLLLF